MDYQRIGNNIRKLRMGRNLTQEKDIKNIVAYYAKKFGTTDPFRIAKELGIIINGLRRFNFSSHTIKCYSVLCSFIT